MEWHHPSPLDQARFDPADVFAAGLAQHHLANTAYPIAHLNTMRPYRVPNSQAEDFAPLAWQEVDTLGLYVHIPFCEKRCGFCEYTVLEPGSNGHGEALQARYFDLLMAEFQLYNQALETPSKTLMGFDIGGGTPSAACVADIARVVEAARMHFHLPETVTISIETTPKIAALEPVKLKAFYDMGIRRISMGVQTIHPRLLLDVGRTATSVSYNLQAAENLREAGFERFNVDVMYGFARQSQASLQATIKHVLGLSPEYVTLYRMRYKGTRLAGQAQNVTLDEVKAQEKLAREMLKAAGYQGTPGKNTFSRIPGDVGTSDYLTGRVRHGTPYLGLGLGAQSLAHKTLAYNCGAADKQLRHYQARILSGRLPLQDLYHLSLPAAMGKMISVAFYFGEVHLENFRTKFGLELEQAFPAEVAFVLEQGLMEIVGHGSTETLRLTQAGEAHYNGVIALFYAGEVKNALLKMSADLEGMGRPVSIAV